MSIMKLDEWLTYIDHLHIKKIDLGLSRVEKLARQLNCTNFVCPVIVVAGTNGKGSCVHCLESIYLAAGYRVGVYTSPHLHQFNERIRINGIPIDDASLITAFQTIEEKRGIVPLSFFEFTTLAALVIFQQSKLDVVILEVGLGGRLDAVNIVDANVAVISTIDLDHMDWLGSDREAIGLEKAGIFRPECPAVCGDIDIPQSILKYAEKLKTPLYCINRDFYYQINKSFQEATKGKYLEAPEESLSLINKDEKEQAEIQSIEVNNSEDPVSLKWSWWSKHQCFKNLPNVSIKHQNVASSLMVVELLSNELPVPLSMINYGLKQVRIPGRFEFWNEPVPCLFDVAHNPQSGRWLAEQLSFYPQKGKRIAVVGMLRDKDIKGTLAPFESLIDIWNLATLEVARGATSEYLNDILSSLFIKKCYNHATVKEAIEAALINFNLACDQLVIFGSFYTVSAAQSYFVHDRVSIK